jgi:hypothetical protein
VILLRQEEDHVVVGGTRIRAVIAGLAGLFVVVACNGAEPTAETSTTLPVTVPAPTTATTSLASAVTTIPKPGMTADEIAVRNVIDLEAAEFAAALDPPDPSRPTLLALNTGDAKARTIAAITSMRDKGEFSRRDGGGPVPHKTDSVVFENPNTAIVAECVIDDRVRRNSAGGVVDDSVVSSIQRTTVSREDGGWRINRRETKETVPTRNLCPHVQ